MKRDKKEGNWSELNDLNRFKENVQSEREEALQIR